jgi:hypothetical protein
MVSRTAITTAPRADFTTMSMAFTSSPRALSFFYALRLAAMSPFRDAALFATICASPQWV